VKRHIAFVSIRLLLVILAVVFVYLVHPVDGRRDYWAVVLIAIVFAVIAFRLDASRIRQVLGAAYNMTADTVGRERLRVTIRGLLLLTATVAGGCAGLRLVGPYAYALAVALGIPCGGFFGYFVGLGLMRILEKMLASEERKSAGQHASGR